LSDLDETLQQISCTVEPFFRRLPIRIIDQPVIGLELHPFAFLADEGDQAFRVGEALITEGDDRAFGSGVDLLDAGITSAAKASIASWLSMPESRR
jgi:hypothetical protein